MGDRNTAHADLARGLDHSQGVFGTDMAGGQARIKASDQFTNFHYLPPEVPVMVEQTDALGVARKWIGQDRVGKAEEAHVEGRAIGGHEDKLRPHAQRRLDRDRVEPAHRVVEHYCAEQAKLRVALAQDLGTVSGVGCMILEQGPTQPVTEQILDELVSPLLAFLAVGRGVNVKVKSPFEHFADRHTRPPGRGLHYYLFSAEERNPRRRGKRRKG